MEQELPRTNYPQKIARILLKVVLFIVLFVVLLFLLLLTPPVQRFATTRVENFLENKLKKAGVDKDVRGWEKSSDHAPVWIEIEV